MERVSLHPRIKADGLMTSDSMTFHYHSFIEFFNEARQVLSLSVSVAVPAGSDFSRVVC